MKNLPRSYLVAFSANGEGEWLIIGNDDVTQVFRSRLAALQFAIKESGACKGKSVINIEGADGLWRSFRPTIVPAANDSES